MITPAIFDLTRKGILWF